MILELLADGSLHLTAIGLQAPHLTADNYEQLLAAARHKSKRAIEEIVAALRPQPPVPSSVRRLPVPKAAEPAACCHLELQPSTPGQQPKAQASLRVEAAVAGPQRPAEIKPLAPEYYKVQLTLSRETYDKLRQAQDMLRHRIPNGDVAVIFDRALTVLVAELYKTKHAATKQPRTPCTSESRGRHIPAAVKRQVWDRDGGRCAFVGTAGRCTERGFLEYHHVVPFADGGAASVDNLQLRCRAHNGYEAERWFGVREEEGELLASGSMRIIVGTSS